MRTLARSLLLSCPDPGSPSTAWDSSVESNQGQNCCRGWTLSAGAQRRLDRDGHGALVRTAALTLHWACPLRKGVPPPGSPRVSGPEQRTGRGNSVAGCTLDPPILFTLCAGPMTAKLRPHFPHSALNDIPANDM